MAENIAVTTDFSSRSREAFAVAAAIARRFRARLSLIHVAERPPIVTPWQLNAESPLDMEKRCEGLEAPLAELAAGSHAFRGLQVETRVIRGESAEAVGRFEEDTGIDLVVMASCGDESLQSCRLGSFTGKLLQLVRAPLLVVPSHESFDPECAPPFEPRRILVPHDFSRISRYAVDVARDWARVFEAQTRLIFVVEELAQSYGHLAGSCGSITDYLEKVRAHGLDHLRRLIHEEWGERDAEAVARQGEPSVEILAASEEFGADLIVMGNRGLSILDRLRLGSVAERTIRGARCPVLLVKGVDEVDSNERVLVA